MRPGQKNRMRGGRGNNAGRRGPNPLTRSYESNGPDVKVRGTPQHIAEKYVQLARDAHSASDTVMAEAYLQHAEHYYRIIAAAQLAQQQAYNLANGIASNDADLAEDEDEFEVAGADRFTFRTPQSFTQPQGAPNGQPGGYGQSQPYDPAGGEQPPMSDAQPMGEGGQPQPYQPQPRGDRQQQFGNRRFDERNNRRFGRERGDRNFGGDRGNGEGRPQGDRFQQDRGVQDRGAQDRGGDRGGQERPSFQSRQDQPVGPGDDQPVVQAGLPSFITAPSRGMPSEADAAPGADSAGDAEFRPRRRRRSARTGDAAAPDAGPVEE
jgi:hypothetical protein